jgi:hypothetical protein
MRAVETAADEQARALGLRPHPVGHLRLGFSRGVRVQGLGVKAGVPCALRVATRNPSVQHLKLGACSISI